MGSGLQDHANHKKGRSRLLNVLRLDGWIPILMEANDSNRQVYIGMNCDATPCVSVCLSVNISAIGLDCWRRLGAAGNGKLCKRIPN